MVAFKKRREWQHFRRSVAFGVFFFRSFFRFLSVRAFCRRFILYESCDDKATHNNKTTTCFNRFRSYRSEECSRFIRSLQRRFWFVFSSFLRLLLFFFFFRWRFASILALLIVFHRYDCCEHWHVHFVVKNSDCLDVTTTRRKRKRELITSAKHTG